MVKDIKGSTAIEFAFIAAIISIAALGIMRGMGLELSNLYNQLSIPVQPAN